MELQYTCVWSGKLAPHVTFLITTHAYQLTNLLIIIEMKYLY
jgi:hypothetical protein